MRTALVASFVASMAVGYGAVTLLTPDQPTVEFTTQERGPTPQALAHEYAEQHGYTQCGPVADMALDDVVLALPADKTTGQPTTDRVVVLDLDQALAGTHLNITACKGKS